MKRDLFHIVLACIQIVIAALIMLFAFSLSVDTPLFTSPYIGFNVFLFSLIVGGIAIQLINKVINNLY